MNNTIGENIKQLRKEANMTQQKLANALQISVSNVTKYEKGQLEPNLSIIYKLCNLFRISADELLSIDNSCESRDLSRSFIQFVIRKYKLDINVEDISIKDKELLLNLATATSKVFLSSLIKNNQ
ncbi:helix-turn-helix transcriptional regulator [Clostridium sp. LQ25]|uniref:helix-turn-helix domain-containing protein n=1 Tax=Clostridium sp. LQ25 TaxID=2992805 RepID=UPI0022550745|nr:helix-turn-helix transcriptional regulator [Clostridium sp. LQ25]UZT06178.1 helix-turn-helix transcriptional regulator [Clostridium sp. LQ25]